MCQRAPLFLPHQLLRRHELSGLPAICWAGLEPVEIHPTRKSRTVELCLVISCLPFSLDKRRDLLAESVERLSRLHATPPRDQHGDLSLIVPIDITEIGPEIRFLEECPHDDPCRP
jgi:hypothetical protein